MAKNKKRKKPQHHQGGGIKTFLKELNECSIYEELAKEYDFTYAEKRKMYDRRFQIRHPQAVNQHVSNKELKLIQSYAKTEFRKFKTKVRNKRISTHEIMLISCMLYIRAEQIEKEVGNDDLSYQDFKKASDNVNKLLFTNCAVDFSNSVIRLSNPLTKQLGSRIRIGTIVKDDPRFEFVSEISGHPAEKKYFKIMNHSRPAYRLGGVHCTLGFNWKTISKENIQNCSDTLYDNYNFYIQSHAINRLKERLDLLEQESLNHTLWENTNQNLTITRYHNRYLSEVKLFDIKIGYFVYEIIENNLVIKTFLFITHNSTPEGDKLQQITGLGKHDISYWKIDRLSTFINLDENQFPRLMKLFDEAGMGDLAQLKEKEFDIESIQSYGFEGLREYLLGGNAYKKQLDIAECDVY